MEWQLIETAPRDGRVVLVSDGERFAAAEPFDYTEPAEIGGGDTMRPNPDAGKVRKLWTCIGCSAFTREPELLDESWNVWNILEPTHWMLIKPPA